MVIVLEDYVKKYDTQALERVKEELRDVIGLSAVKDYVNSLENNLKAQQLRAAQGLKTADISMHMIFTGNPGTGKTTIARIVAKYLKALGVLTTGQLREVSRTDLVGQYAGHTAKLTTEVIRSALGGVLFIDEAYALSRDQSDNFGLEAIDALVKGMEDHRNNLVVILAGYADEMEVFLKTNPGLRSRFPNIIEFEDYTPSEMLEITQMTVKNKGYRIADDCIPLLEEVFEHKQLKGRNDNGNGRLVRNMVEAAILHQSQRIVQAPTQDLTLLTKVDFELQDKPEFDLEAALSKIVGLDDVKDFMRGLEARLYVQEARKEHGLKVDYSHQTLHMIFTGNPGTGKTMMARIAANILYQMGVISTNNIVETDRSGLVAGYVGQTAIKTREVIESALNGVLFIDEAYALAQGGPNDFGQEAIDTLVKMMDDHRDHLVVILAGYSNDMQHFLAQNAGLASRFPRVIEFVDYSTEALMQIAQGMYAEQGYVLPDDAVALLRNIFDEAKTQPHFGNGRFVRNVFEKSLNEQALRLARTKEMSVEALSTIIAEDIKEVFE